MRFAILLLAAISAWAADLPRLSFSKSFPGSSPAYFLIIVDRNGDAFYNESEDPDNAEKLQLEPPVLNQMFALADKLDHFKKPIESGLKVANTGLKTLRWENGAEKSETKYNYSTLEDARVLGDYFERIGECTRVIVGLKRAIRHDRLGVNAAVNSIQTLWNNKRLLATPQFLALLDQVAGNESYVHMARERAAQIADAIRAASPK
jgi:hypothetical protein